MRYVGYILFLYLLLPFNYLIDFIAILLFFAALHEDEKFSIIFAFFAGLLIDLYYPAMLGLNTLIYLLLSGGIIYLKKYITREPLTTLVLFSIFYLTRGTVIYLIFPSQFKIVALLATLVGFLPLCLLLNRILFKVWLRL